MTVTDEPRHLESLLGEIRACRHCAATFPHEPRPMVQASATARIFVCAQAPGLKVHETGLPFNDPSGDRLRDWMGIDRETFYDPARVTIVPMGFCFPGYGPKGGDLPPVRDCARLWHDKLFARLPAPALMLVIGQYAQAYHLGDRRRATLTDTVRYWRDYGPVKLPLPHPSPRNNIWLRKNSWFAAEVLPVLRRRVGEILAP